MTTKNAAVVLLLLIASIVTPVTSSSPENEAPLAEAGLDQDVTRSMTVLLDATESWDSDGQIVEYEWSILTPDNRTIGPDCHSCPRTQFVPDQLGTYEVTITVTDDENASSSDTLFVTVSAGVGPQLDLTGPVEPGLAVPATFTASIEAGTADLSHVHWFVDGERVDNRSVSGRASTVKLTRSFPSVEGHTISAEVYDVDGQQATDSLAITVKSTSAGGNPEESPSIASQASPTISGSKLVLGEPPLQGRYTAQLDTSSSKVTSIVWHTMDGTVGSGHGQSIEWAPGDHHLFAVVTYVDGSRNVARFSDGSTTVVADPEPKVSTGEFTNYGSISSTGRATDEYGNLRSISVYIDGEKITEDAISNQQLRKHGGSSQLSARFSYQEITPQEPHTVRIVATDVRGQTSELIREVTPVGEPEIVKSEFINDPVDSYHERINASRYAAHHVLKIDLNGVDPDVIMTSFSPVKPEFVQRISSGEYDKTSVYSSSTDKLTVHSNWSGISPRKYELQFNLSSRNTLYAGQKGRANLTVAPSKPELRYKVIDTGRVDYVDQWGLVVDAGESFDPDGTDIEYIWKHGANPITSDNSTAKFDSLHRAGLTIRDGYQLEASNNEEFLGYYNPGISQAEELTEGPYKPNESVKFQVYSNIYKLSKNNYDIDLGLDVRNAQAHVTEWDEVKCNNGRCKKGDITFEDDITDNLDIDDRRYRFYTGVIEVDASAFSNGTTSPSIDVYNDNHPEQTRTEFSVPDVNVLLKGSRYWSNVSITDLEYTVEKPQYSWKVTRNETVKDDYLAENYTVDSIGSQLEYLVEHQEKVQDAQYEIENRSFTSRRHLKMFLDGNPEWYDAGTRTTTKTYTTTETEWRDSKQGNGTYTGDTRQRLVRSAQYQLKKEYQYEYQEQKTGTKTVTRTKYRPVQKTGTRTVTKCNRYIGCYESTETYTYWISEPYTYTTTKTYTYYVTKTETYWATGRRHPDHQYTGQSETVKTMDAEYKTQYKYQYETERTETVRNYIGERKVQTKSAKYEWREHETTTNKFIAQSIAEQGPRWRIGDTSSVPEWTLKKYEGYRTEIVGSFVETSHVIETRIAINGELHQKYISPESGSIITEVLGMTSKEFMFGYAVNSESLINIITDGNSASKDSPKWCLLKNTC